MAKLMRNVHLMIAIILELLQQFAAIKPWWFCYWSEQFFRNVKPFQAKSCLAIQRRNSTNIIVGVLVISRKWLIIQIFASAWIVLQYAVSVLVCFFCFVSPLSPGAFKGDWLTQSHLSLVEVGGQGSGSCHCCLLFDRALTHCSTKRLCPVPQITIGATEQCDRVVENVDVD